MQREAFLFVFNTEMTVKSIFTNFQDGIVFCMVGCYSEKALFVLPGERYLVSPGIQLLQQLLSTKALNPFG